MNNLHDEFEIQWQHRQQAMKEAQNSTPSDDGYIAAVDHINHTIWVFFYDNTEESANIMRHIRKDILVFQKK